MKEFSDEELERYSRHIILQDVGIEGQEKIANSKNIGHWRGRTWFTRSALLSRSRRG